MLSYRPKQKILKDFKRFLEVNLNLERKTVENHYYCIRKFLNSVKDIFSKEEIQNFLLKIKRELSPYQYNNYIKALRRFYRDFLKVPEIIEDFKFASVENNFKIEDFVTIEDIRKGFYGLKDDLERALYLFYATTGLRRSEVLNLRKSDIIWELRAVVPRHNTRTKKAGITFFNEEAEYYLKKYLESRKDDDERLFVIGERKFRNMWRRASKAAGKKITPQVLRKWFAVEMRLRGVPDSIINIFQGRSPRSVLEKYYTIVGIKELKRFYKKADLKILA